MSDDKQQQGQQYDISADDNPAGAFVQGMARAMNGSSEEKRDDHNSTDDHIPGVAETVLEEMERKRRKGFFRRLGEMVFGRTEFIPPADSDIGTKEGRLYTKKRVGGLFGLLSRDDDDGSSGQAARSPSPKSPAPPRFINGETFEDDVELDEESGQFYSTRRSVRMDDLKARRIERIEKARVGRPFHERVMLFCLRIWLLLGPVAFVLLTAAEVAYILTHLVSPDDQHGQIVIWGGALFIEFAMMFTTFGLGIKRHEVAEHKEIYGHVDASQERLVHMGTWLWIVFALINIIGQTAFLMEIVNASQGQDVRLLWVFVASRVLGFILGDAGTAFFLGQVDSNDVRLMARAEHERGKLYMELTEAEGKRKVLEAEADSKIQLLEIKVQQERADANFLAQLKEQTFTRILQESPGGPALPAPNVKGALPAPDDDLPLTGEFTTLHANGEIHAPGGSDGQNKVRIRRLDR